MSESSNTYDIPLSLPYVGQKEQEVMEQAVLRDPLHGNGPVCRRVERCMEDWLSVKHVFLTTSCSHALEMAMRALDIGPGDEVIMPSYNFVSSANAVVQRGGTPVFAEIDSSTLNVDPADISRKITPNARVMVPVHYGGVACDMGRIMQIARDHDLFVIEDAAQSIDAYYKDKPLGTIGDIGCFSFHDTKNITCGEGGALITDDDEIAREVEIIREKGTNRSAFHRGDVDKYSWIREGSSYVLADLLAALLEVQLQKRKEIFQKRRKVWKGYYNALQFLARDGYLNLPHVPPYSAPNYHLFYFTARTHEEQQSILRTLNETGIEAAFHYVPLHIAPKGRLYQTTELEKTKEVSETIVRLPVYPQLATEIDEIADYVASVIKEVLVTDKENEL